MQHNCICRIAECVIVGSWSIGIAVAFSPNFQKGVVAANDTFALLHRVPKIRNYPNAITTQWVLFRDYYNFRTSHSICVIE